MTRESDVRLPGGRVLHVHDGGGDGSGGVVVWHHGTPQTGALLPPLVEAAARRGVRVVSYGRPGYGGSSPSPGRDVASAAADVAAVADALELGRFAVVGASGGAVHALACAALLPGRVGAAVCLAGLAPYPGDGADGSGWFAGMRSPGALRASLVGRVERLRYAETAVFEEDCFTAADRDTLAGPWGSVGEDSLRAQEAGPDGQVDDDVAYVRPWGFTPAQAIVPVLLVHGGQDRVVPPSHAHRLLAGLPLGELWFHPRDRHVSVLGRVPVALDWLAAHP